MGRPSKLEALIDAVTIKEIKVDQSATVCPPLYGYHFTTLQDRSDEVLGKQIKLVKSISRTEEDTVLVTDKDGNRYHIPFHQVKWYRYE